MKISGIYKIINKTNKHYYVGSSGNIDGINGRWYEHKRLLNKNSHINKHLQFAWNKYGENNFNFVIVEEVPTNELLMVEQRYLDIAKKEKELIYNTSLIAGKVEMTDEIRKKLSLLNTGENHPQYGTHRSEKTKQKIREKRKLYIFSNETKQKISNSLKGKNNPFFGKHHTDEYKKKSSERCINLFKNKENHPRFDSKIYTFLNKNTKEIFTGTRYDFYTKYNINKTSIGELIKEKRKSIKKWIIIRQ